MVLNKFDELVQYLLHLAYEIDDLGVDKVGTKGTLLIQNCISHTSAIPTVSFLFFSPPILVNKFLALSLIKPFVKTTV